MSRRGDRVSVALFSLTAFLLVLALLGSQLDLGSRRAPAHAAVLVRKIYRTTVMERVIGASSRPGSSQTSVSSSAGPTTGSVGVSPIATRAS
jgi:hypothetical protein